METQKKILNKLKEYNYQSSSGISTQHSSNPFTTSLNKFLSSAQETSSQLDKLYDVMETTWKDLSVYLGEVEVLEEENLTSLDDNSTSTSKSSFVPTMSPHEIFTVLDTFFQMFSDAATQRQTRIDRLEKTRSKSTNR